MPLQRRLPKRGFTNIFRQEYQVVNVGQLEKFDSGAEVDAQSLAESRLVRRRGMPVKLLGTGTLSRPLTVRVHAASAAARQKVESAGGTVEIVTS